MSSMVSAAGPGTGCPDERSTILSTLSQNISVVAPAPAPLTYSSTCPVTSTESPSASADPSGVKQKTLTPQSAAWMYMEVYWGWKIPGGTVTMPRTVTVLPFRTENPTASEA